MFEELKQIRDVRGEDDARIAAYSALRERIGIAYGLLQLPTRLDDTALTRKVADFHYDLSPAGLHFVRSVLGEIQAALPAAAFLMSYVQEDDRDPWLTLNATAFMARGLLANDLPRFTVAHDIFHALRASLEPLVAHLEEAGEELRGEVSHV